jgi:hypothetical protein
MTTRITSRLTLAWVLLAALVVASCGGEPASTKYTQTWTKP